MMKGFSDGIMRTTWKSVFDDTDRVQQYVRIYGSLKSVARAFGVTVDALYKRRRNDPAVNQAVTKGLADRRHDGRIFAATQKSIESEYVGPARIYRLQILDRLRPVCDALNLDHLDQYIDKMVRENGNPATEPQLSKYD